jgi:hypothetical protein
LDDRLPANHALEKGLNVLKKFNLKSSSACFHPFFRKSDFVKKIFFGRQYFPDSTIPLAMQADVAFCFMPGELHRY